MTTLRYEGQVRLLSSMSHGGEHAGTAQFLRREKIIQPDGTVAEVPIVSGNSLRGVLRDISARLLWEQLGKPALTMQVFHALFSGGALAKAGSGNVLGDQQLRRLRELCPHVSLFGCSGGGRIIEGKLMVGKLVPVCAQTAHVLPEEMTDGQPLPDVWDLLQMEEFSRMDDAKRLSSAAMAITDTRTALPAPDLAMALDLGGEVAVAERPDIIKPDAPAQQMRYGVETLAVGTRLHWWVQLRGVTPAEVECFRRAITAWVDEGAHVGGRSSSGHGRLSVRVGAWANDPQLTIGPPLPVAEDIVPPATAEVLEALSWLR